MNPIIVTLLSGAGFLILFAIGELLYHHYKVRAEYTRKFAHVTVGILALTFPAYFISHWQVLTLSSMFFIILVVAKKHKQLQHIHAVPRVTYGSYLYPPTVYGCFILGNKMGFGQFFYIPILVMAVSDPVAAITGLKWGKSITKKKNSKTFLGSLMFLVSAIIATLILRFSIPDISLQRLLLISVLVGLVGMFAEVSSYKGWDNFTIPLSIVLLMFALRYLGVL
jgi:phytol kinase